MTDLTKDKTMIEYKVLRPDIYGEDYDMQPETEGALAVDLLTTEDITRLGPSMFRVGLGIAVHASRGGLLMLRSSSPELYSVSMPHGVGLIDTDYQGELILLLESRGKTHIPQGTRIAQFMPFSDGYGAAFYKVTEFSNETIRSIKGFGSTGGHNSG